METEAHFTRKIIRQPFEMVVDNLITELSKAGFIVSGVTDFTKDFIEHLQLDYKKCKILYVHIPALYYAALKNASINGIIIPCSIKVSETYPGITEVIFVNTIELLKVCLKNNQYLKYMEDIDNAFNKVLNVLEGKSENYPDLITSWE